MAEREFKTKHRITEIMKEKDLDSEEIRKIYHAFDKLTIFDKNMSEIFKEMNKRTFLLDKEKYKEKMQWINDFMKTKGMEEDIFTDLENFEISSDDYDYYYDYKTPTQYKKDEEERNAKKIKQKKAEGRNNAVPTLDD